MIRVESSVSSEDAEEHQVNADNDAVEEDRNAAVTLGDNNQNEKEEEAQKEETTSEATEVSTTTEDDADTLVTSTQAASQQTTTDEDIRYIVYYLSAAQFPVSIHPWRSHPIVYLNSKSLSGQQRRWMALQLTN